jgi:hypothetical protein
MEITPQPQRRQFDRQRSIEIVMEAAALQATPENRENYLRSCEAHGPDLADVVAEVRRRLT